jgi:hypothetical protein
MLRPEAVGGAENGAARGGRYTQDKDFAKKTPTSPARRDNQAREKIWRTT